ncbi:hypothetical protein M9H77_25622 [Catharanthus roseus]|uniref:Uncharacterized protein n=1 Tax=Catharanthus roseus TaxID=4058 RepID=A0ACC0A7N8_CATRO|nr:hypothetical protein M9H77_25622 [Catharanthus roseus]
MACSSNSLRFCLTRGGGEVKFSTESNFAAAVSAVPSLCNKRASLISCSAVNHQEISSVVSAADSLISSQLEALTRSLSQSSQQRLNNLQQIEKEISSEQVGFNFENFLSTPYSTPLRSKIS